MIKLKGKYAKAKVFTDCLDSATENQIIEFLDQPYIKGCKVRIMPDCHAGKGCVIGTTIKFKNKINPSLVGCDIGCGVTAFNVGQKKPNIEVIDKFIHEHIPTGRHIHTNETKNTNIMPPISVYANVNHDRAGLAFGTLGGGNHFIEVDKGESGNYYIVCHSGSRSLGMDIYNYWVQKAVDNVASKMSKVESLDSAKTNLINTYIKSGRKTEIKDGLAELTAKYKSMESTLNPDHCYLEGDDLYRYCHDVKVAERYADYNRLAILCDICHACGISVPVKETIVTTHNYIDDNIIRKGAIARKGTSNKIIIPLNMCDGSIICYSGNGRDWNYSLPHGAGRLMSRAKAKQMISMDDYKKSMIGIYSTTINENTIDEAPMAYKPADEIIKNINDQIIVLDLLKPIYNYKADD